MEHQLDIIRLFLVDHISIANHLKKKNLKETCKPIHDLQLKNNQTSPSEFLRLFISIISRPRKFMVL